MIFRRALALTLFCGAWLAGADAALSHDDAKPQRGDVLFWNQAQRQTHFRAMQNLFPFDTVAHGTAHPLPHGRPLTPRWPDRHYTVAQYMSEHHLAGLMVLQGGRIRLERYALGFDARQRWTSFSVAKSFTSTLLGAALRDGSIHSLDDPLQRYIPAFKGSAYGTVSVRQLATMTSGVRWNEDYADPHSDVAQMYNHPYTPGTPRLVSYMATLPRAYPAGSHWSYNTGETDLLGILVQQATGKSLAVYLSEKIWHTYGMATDAYWLKDPFDGLDTGGSGLSASLADYARMGQFLLDDDGVAAGRQVLPPGWLADATARHAAIGTPGMGYGYQWWSYDDGRYAGIGIFGQLLHVDPTRQLVIVQLGAWSVASSEREAAARRDFVQAVTTAIDRGD